MNSWNKRQILYLFPYAGGSSLSYFKWHDCFKNYEVMSLDYKGHGLRAKEPLDNSIQEVALDTTERILCSIKDKGTEENSIVLFGHSMGGIIAWHTACNLINKYGIYPKILCISGCLIPSEFSEAKHYGIYVKDNKKHVDDNILVDTLLLNGRLDKQFVESERFRSKVLPIIHHDYEMVARYENRQNTILSIPIYTFVGEEDPLLNVESAVKWKKKTNREFRLFTFPGNHYYFEQIGNQYKICKILDQI